MKAFTFKLEKLLNLRKHYEEEAKIELGRAVGVLSEIEGKIAATAAERVRAAAAQFRPGNSAIEIQQYMYYLLRLDNTRDRLIEEAAMAEMKVEQARGVFLEASRERKVLDNLKEKKQKEYKKTKLNEETKTLDDIKNRVTA